MYCTQRDPFFVPRLTGPKLKAKPNICEFSRLRVKPLCLFVLMVTKKGVPLCTVHVFCDFCCLFACPF